MLTVWKQATTPKVTLKDTEKSMWEISFRISIWYTAIPYIKILN